MVSCFNCGKKAVVELPYASASFCKNCFLEHFKRRIRKANKEFGLVRRGDSIAVAVSGGKDSAALLWSIKYLAQMAGNVEVKPVLVDEGIKGYRDKAVLAARQACKKLGFELTVASFKKSFGKTLDEIIAARDRKSGRKEGACSYCGVLRRAALDQAVKELGANKVALGHNADDLAQTFLMNLLRGEVVRNSRLRLTEDDGVAEGFVRRIRPLIFVPERECALFSTLQGLSFHLGACPYSGEAFRGTVKDFLNDAEAKHPGIKLNLLNSFLALRKAVGETTYKRKEKPCEECGRPSSGGRVCKACELLRRL
ncbi:TIGR00269 family protein [Candidatus Micrarchaeota archaeon]|nr:TIGR00269 family protein [Candidatus Micrarchaeota archaeon]